MLNIRLSNWCNVVAFCAILLLFGKSDPDFCFNYFTENTITLTHITALQLTRNLAMLFVVRFVDVWCLCVVWLAYILEIEAFYFYFTIGRYEDEFGLQMNYFFFLWA